MGELLSLFALVRRPGDGRGVATVGSGNRVVSPFVGVSTVISSGSEESFVGYFLYFVVGRCDGRGRATLDLVDAGRMPNLPAADGSLVYGAPFRVGSICRCPTLTGF